MYLGCFFKIVKAMYINNNICVKINNCERTGFLKSNVGVLQGDSLSPLLFNPYISDLKAFLGVDDDTPTLVNSRINCLIYADDLILMSRSETGLQALLDRLGEYCGNGEWKSILKKLKPWNLVVMGTNVSQRSYKMGNLLKILNISI